VTLEVYLVDTETDTIIGRLEDNSAIDASLIGDESLSLAVFTSSGVVGSIKMNFQNGRFEQIENNEPFALFGNTEKGYNDPETALLPEGGDYVLSVEAYDGKDGTGALVETLTIDFSAEEPEATPAETPAVTPSVIEDEAPEDGPEEASESAPEVGEEEESQNFITMLLDIILSLFGLGSDGSDKKSESFELDAPPSDAVLLSDIVEDTGALDETLPAGTQEDEDDIDIAA